MSPLPREAESASNANDGRLLGAAGRQIRGHPKGEGAKEDATDARESVESGGGQH